MPEKVEEEEEEEEEKSERQDDTKSIPTDGEGGAGRARDGNEPVHEIQDTRYNTKEGNVLSMEQDALARK
jgi:hypothetical protein